LSLWEQDPAECDEPARPFAGRVAGPYDRGFLPAFEVEFYLGAHRLNWCWEGRARGPLFVNLHLLLARKGPMLPATVDVGFDSGGYTEIVDHGGWRWDAAEHVRLMRRAHVELGRVRIAAIQDWLCTPQALARTGLSVAEHQARTTRSYLDLRDSAPEVNWCPVLQGLEPEDYWRHRDGYEAAGVDLASVERVMVGSIAARDDEPGIQAVMRDLACSGLLLHALGAKGLGLAALGLRIASADSLAWSARGKGIHRNLCKALGVDRRTLPAEVLRLLAGRELPPRAAVEADLLRRFGTDSRGEVQSLANSQAFSEHWRAEQLAMLPDQSESWGGPKPLPPMPRRAVEQLGLAGW
jgi:hypothetical protein